MNGVLKRPPSEYGLWFLGVPGMFAVGSFAATRLLNTLGLDRSVMLGTISGAVTLAAAAGFFGLFALSPALLFVPAYAIAFFQGMIIPNGVAGAINASPGAFGAASGLVGFVQMTVSAAAAQISGAIVADSIWPLVAIMAVCSGLALILLPLIRRRLETPEATAVSAADGH